MIHFLDLKKQYESIRSEINAAIQEVLDETAFVGGSFVKKFESEFAAYLGANHVVGVGNGTDALEIAIRALALPPGGEIIVPANSFVASAEAVCNMGHRVVFCDCDPGTLTLDVEDVKRRVTKNTVAVMAVHLYGHPANMVPLQAVAKEHGLKIIEDAAQAHGAEYSGKNVGTLGDVAAFSFYPGKNLGAYGDAGAIVTNNEDLATKARMLANHGRINKYDHLMVGRNSRLDGMQAAVLSVKLKHLDAWNERRRQVASWYFDGLSDFQEMSLIQVAPWAKPVFHLFPVRVRDRDALREYLASQGTETGIHYPVALPKLKAFEKTGQSSESMRANLLDGNLLSLPMGEHLGENEVQAVIRQIRSFLMSGRHS